MPNWPAKIGRPSCGFTQLAFAITALLALLGGTPSANAQGELIQHRGERHVSSYALRSSYVLPAPFREHGRDLGDIDTFEFRLRYVSSYQVHTNWSIQGGVNFQWLHSAVPVGAPAPDNLYGAALELGAQWAPTRKWIFQLGLRPGFYSDFEDIDAGDFNLPVLALAYWQCHPRLTAILGFSYSPRRDTPVIPGIGVRWAFADRWNLLLVYPVPRITYEANDKIDLFAGVRLIRTSFRVGKGFGDPYGRPDLNDQDVSYNDWRATAGLRYGLSRSLNLTLEAGWMVEREFNFDDRDYRLVGDGAPFVGLSLGGTY